MPRSATPEIEPLASWNVRDDYSISGSSYGQLQAVTLQRAIEAASPMAVSRVSYGYYGASDANGSLNDLQSASQQLPDGTGGWNTVAVEFYRYYFGTESTGIPHGLKMHFGPEAYRLMFNQGIDPRTAADSIVLPYVDHYFEYDPSSGSVTKEIAAVCPGCPGGGTTADLFAYTRNPRSPAPGYNVWSVKTQQTLPDNSRIIVYSNYAGMPMLKVVIDPTGAQTWPTFYRYDSDGQMIWVAQPSAVNGYDDANDDLLNYNSATGLYQYLNNGAGLINVTHYYSSTDIGAGAVQDYVQNQSVRQGQSGGDVLLRSYTYTQNIDANGNAVYPIAAQVAYPSATDPSITITTSYSYTFYSGANQMRQRTTTLPAVGTSQNGSGAACTTIEQYDAYGHLTQTTDERNIVNAYAYAAAILGAVSEQTLNVQSGVTAPGVNVVTDFIYDDQGRLAQTLGPAHNAVLSGSATTVRGVAYYLYIQSVQPLSAPWAPDQNRVGRGYATGTGPSYTYGLIDPVTLVNVDKDGRTLDQITSRRTTGSGALSPADTFVQTDWQSWTNTQYDDQHRTTGQSVYFLIPSSGTGAVGANFGQTSYGYDALERRNRVVAPGGTITRTVWTTPQRVANVWVGANDTGATASDPTGGGAAGNNMVIVTANQYDWGAAGGDGNLTQQTQYVSATTGDTRITSFGFDFRDRQTSMTDATGRHTLYTFDNLDRQTQVQSYATSGGALFAQSQTNYDDRGRIYQSLTYAVDPNTGAVGNALIGNNWYDPSGNLLQQIAEGDGEVFSKSAYNGVNWVTSSYRGYNLSGTSYSQAGTVANDIIVEQTDNSDDEAGNLISMANSQRLNDLSPSATGALSASTARVTYTANWFDGIDRTIAGANYGAIASFARPTTPPASSSTILVTRTTYNNAGEASQVTDPMGYVTQTSFDAAGRTTKTVEALGTASARTTNYTYTLDNLIATMTAVNPVTGDQTTSWVYGTTLADCGVARNDLLRLTAYPDAGLGWSTLAADQWATLTADQWAALTADPTGDVTKVTYNRLGQQTTFTDQRGTVRTFSYDPLGRLTSDCVTTVGSNTDTAVLQIAKGYEVRGMVSTITSTDNATPGGGAVLNQVVLTYNSFGQLITDQQSHGGAVVGGTPSVQYAYDLGASGSNEIRLTGLTYPNGRIVSYNYATGMDAALNRVTSISDTTATLAAYNYLGGGTVVRITYPQPSVWLDLWGGTSGVFDGLDQFNRVIDQRWQNQIPTAPTDIDRYQYGYDQNSNRLNKANVVGTAAVSSGLDEFYTYDPLNRLTEMQRGVLNSTRTGITGTPSAEQDWTLDPTGNWSGFVTKASGTETLNQSRTANPVNEITNITESTGPSWVVPAYDPAGNTTTMPQVTDPTQSFTATYDAWNRMTSISASGSTVAQYQYDGRNFRVVKQTYSGGSLSETRDFYFTAGWQDVEERTGTSTIMDKQYVWAPLNMVGAGTVYIDELVCRDDATPKRLYVTQDANFNPTSVIGTLGVVLQRHVFDPYGAYNAFSQTWGPIEDAFSWTILLTGQPMDLESGLYLYRSRHYHWKLAVFLERDGGRRSRRRQSLYEYVRSQPVSRTDPSGFAHAIPKQPDLSKWPAYVQVSCEDGDFSGCDTICKGPPNNFAGVDKHNTKCFEWTDPDSPSWDGDWVTVCSCERHSKKDCIDCSYVDENPTPSPNGPPTQKTCLYECKKWRSALIHVTVGINEICPEADPVTGWVPGVK